MENWRRAGWVTGTYDADTNIAYWGTGNGGPWIGDQRPGDNQHRVHTGHRRRHRQDGRILPAHANESWDWGRGVAAGPRRLPSETAARSRGSSTRRVTAICGSSSGRGTALLSTASRTCTRTSSRRSTRSRDAQRSTRIVSPAPESLPSSVRRLGGRTGRLAPSTRRRGMSLHSSQQQFCACPIGRKVEYEPGQGSTRWTTELYADAGLILIGEVQAECRYRAEGLDPSVSNNSQN